MRSEWRQTTLGDLIEIKHGFAYPGEFFVDEPTQLILVTPGSFKIGGGFDLTKRKYYSADGPSPNEYRLQPGDLLVTMTDLSKTTDALGFSAIVPSLGGVTFLHNQRVGRVLRRPDAEIDLGFAHWLMRTPSYRRTVVGTATGTTVKHTSPSRIYEYSFSLPPLEEQRRIAAVLSALDAKVLHNETLAASLAALVSAQARELLEQHPSDRVPLSSVARFINGKAFTKTANGKGRPILKIKELNSGIGAGTVFSDVAADIDNVAYQGDLLFSWSGTLDVFRWNGPESLINQHIFKVLPAEPYPVWLVEAWVRTHLRSFRTIAKDKAVTMGHIRKGDLDEALVTRPEISALNETRNRVNRVDELRSGYLAEARLLASIRDALLPSLIAGRIEVPDSYKPNDPVEALAGKRSAAA